MQNASQGMLIRGYWGDTYQCILMSMQESWPEKGDVLVEFLQRCQAALSASLDPLRQG